MHPTPQQPNGLKEYRWSQYRSALDHERRTAWDDHAAQKPQILERKTTSGKIIITIYYFNSQNTKIIITDHLARRESNLNRSQQELNPHVIIFYNQILKCPRKRKYYPPLITTKYRVLQGLNRNPNKIKILELIIAR